MRNATLNASIAALAPKKYARTVSRTTPSTRLAIVARLMRPADRARRELIEMESVPRAAVRIRPLSDTAGSRIRERVRARTAGAGHKKRLPSCDRSLMEDG